ncbi:MAG: prepilin peptidase [Bradymonadaceae bacterium]
METLLSVTPWRTWLVLVPLGVVVTSAAVTDARDRRIPNNLTYPAFVFGLVAHGLALGWWALGYALLAALAVFIVGLLLMAFGLVGGGDVKLLMCIAAFTGFGGLSEIFFYSIVAGGILGFVYAIFDRHLIDVVGQLFRFLRGLWRQALYRTTALGEDLDDREERADFPFGVAVFAGTVLAFTEARFGWPGLLSWYLAHTALGQ